MTKPTKAQAAFLKNLKATGPVGVYTLGEMASPKTINFCVANGWASVDTSVSGSPKLVITDAGKEAHR